MVHLGVDLTGVETLSNLDEGLKQALEKFNLEIREKKTPDFFKTAPFLSLESKVHNNLYSSKSQ